MKRDAILCLICAAGICFLCAEDDLPRREPGNGLDFEPNIILGGLPDNTPGYGEFIDPSAGPERLAAVLEQARKAAARYQALFRKGVVAKIDAEKRELEVVKRTMELEQARLAVAQRQVDSLRDRGVGSEQLHQAEQQVAAATVAATKAEEEWKRAQLEAATLDVERKRRLFKSGAARRSDVQRAEERLASLQRELND